MPQYGHLQRTFQDAQGRPIAALTIQVRRQGATVNGLHSGAQTSFTVNDPGGILDSPADQLQVGVDDSVTRAVSTVAATNVTVGATGFTNVADDARLTPTTNLPSLYADARGAEAAVLPLTTDANGEIVDANGAIVWAPIVPYDLHVSGATYTTRLLQDVVPEGMESVVSNIFPSATSVAFQKDTLRAQVSGSVLEQWMSGGAVKFSISLNAALEAVLSAHHVVGPVTIDSGDLVMGAAVSQLVPGVTSFSLRNNADTLDNLLITDAGLVTARAGLVATAGGVTATAGGVTATAGGVTATTGNVQASAGNALARRFVSSGIATAHVAGDWSLSAGWGSTASVTAILSNDLRGFIEITSGGTGQAANPIATLTFKDGTFGSIAPQFVVCRGGDVADQPTVLVFSYNASLTQWAFGFRGTPVAGERYQFHFVALG